MTNYYVFSVSYEFIFLKGKLGLHYNKTKKTIQSIFNKIQSRNKIKIQKERYYNPYLIRSSPEIK